ncbi:MAG TPA: LysM domain-containing protein [Flavobacterium sp.]|jgi:hypothetical protein
MAKHFLHIVQKGDTLQSVAKKYTITAEELRHYHNAYCEVPDLLEHDITHQEELLIPKPKPEGTLPGTPQEKERKRTPFAPGNTLIFSPVNSHYNYGVMITMENGEEKNELQYEITVKWVQMFEGLNVFEIDRISKIYINEEEANNMADTLAYKTSKVLYPMQILVDREGQWKAAARYNRYPGRWKTIKQEIHKEFEGELAEGYLLKIEKILENPELITRYMLGDLFLRTLFQGYCTNYGKGFTAEKHITFPIIDSAIEPRYKIQAKTDPYLDEYNLINIKIEGVLDDGRSRADFINENLFAANEKEEKEEKVPFGDITIQAFLNPNSCIPEEIHLECSIDLEETKKVAVIIANLSETASINVHNRAAAVFESETTVPKKSFWNGIKEFFKEMNDPEYRKEKGRQEIAENLKKYHNKK